MESGERLLTDMELGGGGKWGAPVNGYRASWGRERKRVFVHC